MFVICLEAQLNQPVIQVPDAATRQSTCCKVDTDISTDKDTQYIVSRVQSFSLASLLFTPLLYSDSLAGTLSQ
jgi:hypothetical protein